MKPLGSPRARGFTYLGLLFIITLLGLTAAMASVVWSTEQRRENERQLVFVGRQFQAAIEHYSRLATGPEPRYPRELNDLLRDPRAVNVRRHLRQVYVDPMTGEREWGLIRLPDGGIVGVHSLSERTPLRQSFAASAASQASDESYRSWRFIAPSAAELVVQAIRPEAEIRSP